MKKLIFSIACVVGILGFVGNSGETSQAGASNTPITYLSVDPGTH